LREKEAGFDQLQLHQSRPVSTVEKIDSSIEPGVWNSSGNLLGAAEQGHGRCRPDRFAAVSSLDSEVAGQRAFQNRVTEEPFLVHSAVVEKNKRPLTLMDLGKEWLNHDTPEGQ
jgi:hypothetical protein